jgi:hypothetical protein
VHSKGARTAPASTPLARAARPALMSRATHSVKPRAVVRIEVTASPRPCLGCALELVLRIAPLCRGVPPRRECSSGCRLLRQWVVMTAQNAQADVLLHRLHYALSGWDAAAERRGAQDELHSAAQARA